MTQRNAKRPEQRPDTGPGTAGRLLRWIFALVLLGLMMGGGHQMLRWEPDYLPVRVVTVDGELERLSPKRLQETVIDHLHGGIITQDLDELKEAVEALAWVRSASLRRVWPDRLELTVVEHEPFARWGDDGLVSPEGVVFRPPASEMPEGLPLLNAADARAPELVERLQAWRPRFVELGVGIEVVRLDARGAWSLVTDAGFDLALGKLQVGERVDRFLSAWPSLDLVGRPVMVDMRYSNGLAVTWSANDERQGGKAEAHAGAEILHGADLAPTVAQTHQSFTRAPALDPRSPRS